MVRPADRWLNLMKTLRHIVKGCALFQASTMDDSGKQTFFGHDAVAGRFFNDTAIVVTFFPDLGDFEKNLITKLQLITDLHN